MNTWSNIEIQPVDPEIIRIDHSEKTLKHISPDAKKTRETGQVY
jgi:hypothetical protein